MVKGILFDVDGVIVITEHLHYQAWQKLCQEEGIKLTQEKYFREYSGSRSQDIIKKIFHGQKRIDKENVLIKKKENLFKEIAQDKIKAVPGLLPLLASLKDYYSLALATSIPRMNISFYLDRLNVEKYFKAKVIAEDVKKGKPNPEVYLLAAQKLNLKPQECLVIEDSPKGLASAKRAGMKCLIVLNRFNKSLDFPSADLIINRLSEINLETINRLNK